MNPLTQFAWPHMTLHAEAKNLAQTQTKSQKLRGYPNYKHIQPHLAHTSTQQNLG